TPQPTPFPKIDLDDVRVSYTQADDSDSAVDVAVEATIVEPAVETEAAAAIDSQPAADTPATDSAAVAAPELSSLASLQPVTEGQVNISAVNVRQDPSPEAAKQAVLTAGQQVDVLGVNPTRDWALIQTPTLSGWVSLAYIDLADALDDAPVISPESTTVNAVALATITAATQAPEPAASNVISGDDQSTTQDDSEQTVAHLGPIATAHIAVNKTEVRPGPGTDFAPIDELTDPVEQLTIVGVDPERQWALIEPEFETSRLGWVALSDVEVSEGDLAAAPEVYTGWTNSNALALRTGPGIYTDEVGRLAINNLVRVVGLNDGRSWARVQPILGSGDGWTQIQYLTLSDKVANIPLAPVPPSAPEPEPIDPALADASAKEGKLALQLSSGGDIVTLNADGTGLATVTQGIDPQLSPDGSQLAFTRWEGGEAGNGTLWVRDLSSGSETAVLGFIKQPKGPDWSPDGSQIVINYQNGGELEEQQVDINLTKRKANVPWNAGNIRQGRKDGDPYLYYTIPADPHWGLRVVDVADGSYEDMDGGTYAFRPAWDPSQEWRIVSDGGRGLLAGDVNRAEYHQTLTEQVGDGSPVFSPDGQYLAFSSGRGGDGYDIYRLNADGSGRVRLTETPLWAAVTPESQGQQWSNVAPAWSPDGTQIAFLTNRTDRWEVWVMNADGSNPRPMFSDDINDQLDITYNFVDERMISWR
ncbi:MAG: PD40 domain-containing protein, partial [Anaerolineales bacterium]|nr:PD40 domain-containing protein [Anaerolineales bacterium]